MQRNRPPVHGGPAAPNPYFSPNLNPSYLQYSNPNHPPYYPQPIIPIPIPHHHPQQLYSTNGFNSKIQLPGAVLNPAMSVYPYTDSSNLYNAPPQLGLAHAYPEPVASAPSTIMSATSVPSVMEPASGPSALAAAMAAVMAAYCQEFTPDQITLNPHSNGVAIQPKIAETFVAANPKPTFGVTIQPNVAEPFVAANPKPTFGVTIQPNVAETLVAANPKPTFSANPEPTFSKKIKRVKKVNISKKAQIQSQPGWCKVCKIDCNSETVLLNSHILGKKHKKNLEKLAPSRTVPASTSKNTRGNPDKSTATISKNAKRKAPANVDYVERKKKKMWEDGAAAGSVRMCDVCKVVCNSETVFKDHLEGSKHAAAMMKKHGFENTVVSTSKGKKGN